MSTPTPRRTALALLAGLLAAPWACAQTAAAFPQKPVRVLDKLSADIRKVVRTPDAQASFIAAGFTPTGTTRDEFARIIASDTEVWGKAVRATGFKAN